MLTRILSRVLVWAKAHHFFNSLKFEERGVTLWAFIGTWEKDTFRLVAVTISDRFSSDVTHKLSVLGSIVAAVGVSVSLVALPCGSHMLFDTYGDYLGNGYDRKLVESPMIELRLLKWCQQRKYLHPFLDLWIHSPWRILLSREWSGRASRLDDVTFRSSSCHFYRRANDDVAPWGGQQHRGSVASHCCLP